MCCLYMNINYHLYPCADVCDQCESANLRTCEAALVMAYQHHHPLLHVLYESLAAYSFANQRSINLPFDAFSGSYLAVPAWASSLKDWLNSVADMRPLNTSLNISFLRIPPLLLFSSHRILSPFLLPPFSPKMYFTNLP